MSVLGFLSQPEMVYCFWLVAHFLFEIKKEKICLWFYKCFCIKWIIFFAFLLSFFNSYVIFSVPALSQAKLPRGIHQVRPHLKNIDNVPLLVPLFTDCTPDSESSICVTHLMCDFTCLALLSLLSSFPIVPIYRSRDKYILKRTCHN